jgi:hypothetical protein
MTLPSSAPLVLQTFTFTTIGGQLSFSENDVGNSDIGNILDNVTLSTATAGTQAVASDAPETSTWSMMILGFSGLAFARYRSRRAPISIV